MSSPCVLLGPMRRLLTPRPAIQAWRGTRCLSTQVSSSYAANLPPMPAILDVHTTTSSAVEDLSSGSLEATNAVKAPTWKKANEMNEAELNKFKEDKSKRKQDTQKAKEESRVAATMISNAEKSKAMRVGVVVSAEKMDKTVKVRIPGQKFHKYLRKVFRSYSSHLVHDPASSLRLGDVVSIRPHRAAKNVHHIVHAILTPFGPPITARPAVPTEEQVEKEYQKERMQKLERRRLRRKASAGDEEAAKTLEERGILTPEKIAEVRAQAEEAARKKKATMKAMKGSKGQILPKGVLPGGKHDVGKIQDRARENKEKAVKRGEKAEANLSQAKEMN